MSRGLGTDEARRRLAEHGPNVLAEPPRPSRLGRFAANLVHLFALLLWGGAVLAFVAGMPELSIAIVVVVLVNAFFAFAQEYRAERASDALRRMLPQTARVRRDGVAVVVPAEELVPGDVVLLEPGDRVSADANVLVRHDLRVDQSTLTGESRPVDPADRVRMGTHVARGTAEVEVTATGMATEFGRIAELAQRVDEGKSPLEREIDHVTRIVAVLVLALGVVFFVVAGWLGMGLTERFVFTIGVMVANVPEGLLPTVTLSLGLATQRMARRHALVRRLSSVETLGETTVICTDKTGTLTENELTVERLWTPRLGHYDVEGAGYEPFGRFLRDGLPADPRPLRPLLRTCLLCNDARVAHGEVVGDPTEGALVVLAEKGGLRHAREVALRPRIDEIPFDSERKRMTTIHTVRGRRVAYVKGAAEVIVPRTTSPPEERAQALVAAEEMEKGALRVLAVASRELPEGVVDPDEVETELELLGVVGMLDPPRPEVPAAVASCRRAGIRIVMVTGDSGWTAEAVARRIGLVDHRRVVGPQADVHGRREVQVLGPRTVDRLDDAELARILRDHDVIFARIDPEQKLRLARILRAGGEVVAMTGDGVNDAPALREADIGVAMGKGGTDVARETADMVLLDDNFASIVAAVEEGRAVFDNIRRFALYHFASNVAELVPFLVWGLSGGRVPLPLVVMQVLAIDLGTDMLPAIALGTEKAEPGTMQRPPRPREERLLSPRVLARVYGWVGLWEALAGMSSFFVGYLLGGWRPGQSLPSAGPLYVEATTMTQTGIVMGQVGAGMAMRTSRRSVFSVGLLSNRFLLAGIAFELALAACLIYVPGLNTAFHQSPIGPAHWAFLAIWPFVLFGAEEARKAVVRRRARRRPARPSDRHARRRRQRAAGAPASSPPTPGA
ncbi:MAG TPA: cation-transporting P-type ATPase [Gaiellaceae bacterium]|nr:cation-transporting P-type ATPase [Gaiellaceae bacterium]